MENVINDVERINEIQAIEEYLKTIETDVEQVNEKCRKIDCLIIREAVDAFFKLIFDLFRCCFKKCLKSS
jgi:hypothetical protein